MDHNILIQQLIKYDFVKNRPIDFARKFKISKTTVYKYINYINKNTKYKIKLRNTSIIRKRDTKGRFTRNTFQPLFRLSDMTLRDNSMSKRLKNIGIGI